MSIIVDYPTFTAARTHFKEVLDSNAQGITVTIGRDDQVSAVVPANRLREYFFRTVAPRIRVLNEDGVVIALMDGRPFVSEGADIESALDDLVITLREYGEDWENRLQHAPNHAQQWALVQLVKLSTDDELRQWFSYGGE